MTNRILVIGATGMLGEPVVRHLKGKGFEVRIFSRNKKKAETIFGNEFEILEGDLFNRESLKSALKNCIGVHINLSGEIEQIGVESVVTAAKDSEIQKISYISGTSVAEDTIWFPMARRKYFAEKSIRESGINYTIFCPDWFMEVLPKFVKDGKAFVFGKQPEKYPFIAAEDYARMVAQSYLSDEAVNKRFFIHGPEKILFKEALGRYCRVFHPEIKKVATIPFWLVKLIASVKKSEEMRQAGDIMYYSEKSGRRGDPSEANGILGAPEITLDIWLERKKANTEQD